MSSAASSEILRLARASVMLAFSGVLIQSCSVVWDADALAEGCPAGSKACDDECVSTTDPATGCGRSSCQPCALPHTTAVCGPEGDCVIASCIGSFENCNGDVQDGCEADTNSSTEHCGSCTAPPCDLPNAIPDCAGGQCAMRRCITGFADCDAQVDNGCETNVASDTNNCGACRTRCLADEECASGVCL